MIKVCELNFTIIFFVLDLPKNPTAFDEEAIEFDPLCEVDFVENFDENDCISNCSSLVTLFFCLFPSKMTMMMTKTIIPPTTPPIIAPKFRELFELGFDIRLLFDEGVGVCDEGDKVGVSGADPALGDNVEVVVGVWEEEGEIVGVDVGVGVGVGGKVGVVVGVGVDVDAQFSPFPEYPALHSQEFVTELQNPFDEQVLYITFA